MKSKHVVGLIFVAFGLLIVGTALVQGWLLNWTFLLAFTAGNVLTTVCFAFSRDPWGESEAILNGGKVKLPPAA